jgi:hypothetical protein
MEIQGLSPLTSFLVSMTWLAVRITVVVITPFFLEYDCDNDLKLFLQIIYISTIFMVFLQICYLIMKACFKKKSLEVPKVMQVLYFILDYIFYGLFRFVIFILGVVWIIESEHCDDMILYYSIALCIGYFGICWSVCWVGCVSMFVLCWDAQTS